jgi:hypothetical protein
MNLKILKKKLYKTIIIIIIIINLLYSIFTIFNLLFLFFFFFDYFKNCNSLICLKKYILISAKFLVLNNKNNNKLYDKFSFFFYK